MAGYTTPSAQTVTVVAGQTATASFTLQTSTNPGSIAVTSTPSGASIFLDGADSGYMTPYTLTNVAPGAHTVSVRKSGYMDSVTKSVTVVTGSTTSVSFTLTSSTGSIRVSSSPLSATIYLDGVNTGKVTTSTLTGVPTGTHTVYVVKSGYAIPIAKSVTVVAGGTARVSFTLSR
jgi:hypothetical protein